MKICPKCGTQNSDDSTFCENCGTDLSARLKSCPRCQTMNDEGSRFCENCGYDFDATQNTAKAAPTPQQPQKQPVEVKTGYTGQAPQNPKPGNKWVIIAILLLIVGAGGYYIYSSSNKDSGSETQVSKPAKKKSDSSSSSSSSKPAKNDRDYENSVKFNKSKIQSDAEAMVDSIDADTSVYVSPVASGKSVELRNRSQSSASSIKIFIMVTAYAMAKEKVFDLNDTHTLTDDEKVGGTGVLQNMSSGTELTYREIIEHMIDDSDNTAANIIIDKLGGFDLVNNKIRSLGATDTKLRRMMMDTDAIEDGQDNTTSARDMGVTLKKLYNHKLVSRSYDSEMLEILRKNQNHNKLPKLLPSDATIYNKTGEFADYGVENDAAIIKNNKGAFVVVVLSQNGESDEQISAMNDLGLKLYQDILE